MPTVKLIVKGKVHGVFYRATAKEVADKIGVKGWIKNREDESVEATITGTDEQIKDFTEWCKQGPPRAKVEDVLITKIADEKFDEFKVIRKQ